MYYFPTNMHCISDSENVQMKNDSLCALAMASTTLTQLKVDKTFITHEEVEAIEDVLARNVNLSSSHVDIASMTAEIKILTKKFQMADRLLGQLTNEKQTIAQLHSKREKLTQFLTKTREDSVNQYLRAVNSVAQAKRRAAAREQEIKQLEKVKIRTSQLHSSVYCRD